jgi:hypothetical protein
MESLSWSNKIQKVSFVKEVKEVNECVVKERAIEQAKQIISNPFNIWSIFGFSPANLLVGAGANTRQEAPFQLQRRLGMEKVVTISNISGKTAYVILTPSKIKTIESVGIGAKDVSFTPFYISNADFNDIKKIKKHKINSRSFTYDGLIFSSSVFILEEVKDEI